MMETIAVRIILDFFIRTNRGEFGNNSEIDTLISKRLSVENKAKLSQVEIVLMRCFEFPVERVWLCSLQIIALKLVCQFRYCYQIPPCYTHCNGFHTIENLFRKIVVKAL